MFDRKSDNYPLPYQLVSMKGGLRNGPAIRISFKETGGFAINSLYWFNGDDDSGSIGENFELSSLISVESEMDKATVVQSKVDDSPKVKGEDLVSD